MKRKQRKKNAAMQYAVAALGAWIVVLGLGLALPSDSSSQIYPRYVTIPIGVVVAAVLLGLCIAFRFHKTLYWAFQRHRTDLRRCGAFLCVFALVVPLTMVQKAEAANVSGNLTDQSIGLSYDFIKGTASYGNIATQGSYSWIAEGTKLVGTITPTSTSLTYKGSGGCDEEATAYYYYEEETSVITISNNSSETRMLSFDYSKPTVGTLTIDGTEVTTDGSFNKQLAAAEAIQVTLATPSFPLSGSLAKPGTAENTPEIYTTSTTLSNVTLTPINAQINVHLEIPNGGRYTSKAGSDSLTVGESYTNPVTTSYTFTATPDANYQFDGWYVNGVKVADTTTYTRVFSAADSSIEARFATDPLFSTATFAGEGDLGDYLEFDSDYQHSTTGNYHTNVGKVNTLNSVGVQTRFPYCEWSINGESITSSASGAASSDNNTQAGQTAVQAQIYSDILRIKCIQPCTITYNYSGSTSPVKTGANVPNAGIYLFSYVTASGSASVATIKGTNNANLLAGGVGKPDISGTAAEISLNTGDYLYLCFYANPGKHGTTSGNGYDTMNYEYSATISNFTVVPNEVKYQLTIGNYDNTNAVLKSGKVKVNGVDQNVSAGPIAIEVAGGAEVILAPGTSPNGYTFIGWYNATTQTYDYTSGTYTVTMAQNTDIRMLYVPTMTINTGGENGYGEATYSYKNLNGEIVPADGLYVARDATCTNFYTTLKDAFEAKDTVVLLAGDTINGDMTIPAGKTLVIPRSMTDSGPTSPAQSTATAGISYYCTVTFNGNLTVDGSLIVSAEQTGATGRGRPTGGIGYLKLGDTSKIIVNGTLYAFGLVRGGTEISVNSGATVYELMEMADIRAVLVTQAILNDGGLFPFNNFSIKSIEDVPVVYQTDARLYACYSTQLQGMTTTTYGDIPVLGPSGSLFNMTQGSFTKWFDLDTDKTTYRVDEGATVESGHFAISLEFKIGTFPSVPMDVDTADYWMPLNAGFAIQVDGNLTVNSDFKFLPGAMLDVGENGVCTIAEGKNIVFYRLNDYDIRGAGIGTNYQGFGSSAYPLSASNFPNTTYHHPSKDTVGSARLNVDGKMVVNGGLYVTNDLCEDAYEGTYYENGYNVLTGRGSIDLSEATFTSSDVKEAMQTSGSNDPQYVYVAITPIAGLTADATADRPESYQAFTVGSTFYGAYRPLDGGIYVWQNTPFTAVAAINDSTGSGESYIYLSDAVLEYPAEDGTAYIQVLADSNEPGFAIDKDVYLDLNGKTVTLTGESGTGTLTINEGATLYGMDSATEDYSDARYGKIVGTVSGTGKVAVAHGTYRLAGGKVRRYVSYQVFQNEGVDELSFHRYNMSVTKYEFHFRPNGQCDMDFGATFRGSPTVVKLLKDMGFKVEKTGTADSAQGWWSTQNGGLPEDLASGYVLRGTLINIGADQPKEFTQDYDIYALLKFQDDTVVKSVPRNLNYLWALKKYYLSDEATAEKQAIIDQFVKDKNLTEAWNKIQIQ